MKRATTSLPVPDSPVSSTVVSVCATRVACASTSFHCLRSPDDAPQAAPRLELAGERGDLRFETGRGLARLLIAPRRSASSLVRQRQRQVIGHPAREVDVVVAELVRRRATMKNSDPKTSVPSGSGTRSSEPTPKRATQPAERRLGAATRRRRRARCRRRAGAESLVRLVQRRSAPRTSGSSTFAPATRIDARRGARLVPRGEHQQVVRQPAADHRRTPRETPAGCRARRPSCSSSRRRLSMRSRRRFSRSRTPVRSMASASRSATASIVAWSSRLNALSACDVSQWRRGRGRPGGWCRPACERVVGVARAAAACRCCRCGGRHLHLAGGAGDVAGERLGPVEPQHVQLVERDRRRAAPRADGTTSVRLGVSATSRATAARTAEDPGGA